MGSKSVEKQIRRRLGAEAGEPSFTSGRRGFLGWGIGIVGTLLAGGVAIERRGSEEAKPVVPAFAPEPEEPASADYLNVREAVEVYNGIKRDIEKAYEEAKRTGKPLRVFMLEEHSDANSLAYEMMVIDIVNNLTPPIKVLLTEGKDDSLRSLRENPDRTMTADKLKTRVKANWEDAYHRLAFAYRQGMAVKGIDPYTTEETQAVFSEKAKPILERKILERFGISGMIKSVKMDDRLIHFSTENADVANWKAVDAAKVDDYQKLSPKEQLEQLNLLLGEASLDAIALISKERRDFAAKAMAKEPHSVVMFGHLHGKELVTETAKREEPFIAFAPFVLKPQDKIEFNAYLQQQAQWSTGLVSNVIRHDRYAKKNFNSTDLDAFMGRVLGRVHQAELAR